ncbi:DNA mismatch repair endonuclease MutL [Flavihumibacter petaseus]|uniref:DNA mismatch repair endonuclease MutL n=1 Tax=Flavihumibacter petaseus TaxID=549295 RepID=UPI00061D0187|nr:DNA mismatch repair endonuclease MutL [Flavihumibacter petaseus]
MGDSIQLLPDHIANQIAAGEVIQRPASAVKELLENSVDAGATEIRLIVADAGKSLIQVADNGKGMSETDARLCFERHATSKISQIDDLFHIQTMGFRGEALASVAAVAQVDLKTRRAADEAGTHIEIENSMVVLQEPCAMAQGTSIAMKNLFFNIPARRNFLKSNAAEMRHIIDEFIRVAMAFPQLFFSLSHNGQNVFHLDKGSLKQRIVQVLGNQYNAKLVPVQEQTDYLNIQGFIGKPEAAKKTRGDQFFFVNNRFIRSAYLHHAVMQAFQDLIPADAFPTYVLFIDLQPDQIDVNVHPTKQEIKFEDEKIVYAFVQAAVKHALAQFSIMPSLEFDIDSGIQQLDAVAKPFTPQQQDAARDSGLFRSFTQQHQAHFIEKQPASGNTAGNTSGMQDWKSLLSSTETESTVSAFDWELPKKKWELAENAGLLQLESQYLIAPLLKGCLLIHQQLAHERVLYERYAAAVAGRQMPSQQTMFPVTIDLSAADSALLTEMLADLQLLGYGIEPFGTNAFIIQGTPADLFQGNEKAAIEALLEQYKHFNTDVKFSRREKLIRSLAAQHAIKRGTALSITEMRQLAEDLLRCATPNITPGGQPTFIEFTSDYLFRLFDAR